MIDPGAALSLNLIFNKNNTRWLAISQAGGDPDLLHIYFLVFAYL
jgi:hypothetical protein